MASPSSAQKRAVANYKKKHYDVITINVPKGFKAVAQKHAQKHDASLTAFVNRAIRETMERDNQK